MILSQNTVSILTTAMSTSTIPPPHPTPAIITNTPKDQSNLPNVSSPLPPLLLTSQGLTFDTALHPLYESTIKLLQTLKTTGSFPPTSSSPSPSPIPIRLEDFACTKRVFTDFKERQKLYKAVSSDEEFLKAYEDFIVESVLPSLTALLEQSSHDSDVQPGDNLADSTIDPPLSMEDMMAVAAKLSILQNSEENPDADTETDAERSRKKTKFHVQFPPTLRLHPGNSSLHGPVHCDSLYGHQAGEVNFWLPLTSYTHTLTGLRTESSPNANDFTECTLPYGSYLMFHGVDCRHYAPVNASGFTRVSLDFRVGVGEWFDEGWVMEGVRGRHSWRVFEV